LYPNFASLRLPSPPFASLGSLHCRACARASRPSSALATATRATPSTEQRIFRTSRSSLVVELEFEVELRSPNTSSVSKVTAHASLASRKGLSSPIFFNFPPLSRPIPPRLQHPAGTQTSSTPPSRTGIASLRRRKKTVAQQIHMSSTKGKPAFMDEFDEGTGKVVRGHRQVASTKQKPKVSHRDSRKSRNSPSHTAYPGEGSSRDAPAVEVVREEEKNERRKSTSSGSSKSPRKTRPPSAHENKGFPKLSIPTSSRREDPANYGIATPTSVRPLLTQPIPHRSRSVTAQSLPSRPVSYHAAMPTNGYSRPPLSLSAFYQQQPIITPSYPPASPSYLEHVRYTPAPQSEYFQPQATSRPLSSRFEPISRPPSAFEQSHTQSAFDPAPRTPSAFGARSSYEGASSYFDDTYASASEGATIRRERRDSIRVPSSSMTKAQADYAAMPPPSSRPGILRRATEYRAPTEYTIDPDLYRDGRTQYRDGSLPRRPSANRHSVSYDLGRGSESIRVEAANSSRRRQTWYEPPVSTATGYEDKLHQATTYQEDVAGPTVPLTAETLKRQQRRQAGSSRSTKSSQSRDESDYKKSASTRTTRSMSNDNDENVTIKVTGQARVMVGGAQIDCNEGGEIEIKRQKSLRNGSERSNSEYGAGRIEDRQSRVEQSRPSRSSRSEQSRHSYTRSTPHYPMDNAI
jgi:hypothetical protein